jgi:predicted amidohydrolase
MFLASVIQLSSTADVTANLEQTTALISRAAGYGAQLVATPENTNFLGPMEEKVRRAEDWDGPTCTTISDLARKFGIYVLLGSFNQRSADPGRVYNTSALFDPDGAVVARYRKIHLFDVDLSERVRFRESDSVIPGETIEVASTPLGCIGLSVCYDLRFPELYGRLVEAGAEILAVPSAFTMTTGRDHWEPLLRARAIENQCFVMAPAQWGTHDSRGTRESYGHAMMIDPWGNVIATAADGTGVAAAEIDLSRVREIRSSMPVHRHRRKWLRTAKEARAPRTADE